MKKLKTVVVLLATLLFITAYAESVTETLPQEFFDNADLYGKLDMIENLSILKKISKQELNLAIQMPDSENASQVSP